MADYSTNRSAEKFIFKRVSWSTWAEVGAYDQFTGGSIDYGAYSQLKVSAALDYTGEAPDTTDLVRVYYQFTDDAGETAEHALGTFLVGYTTESLQSGGDGLLSSGSVTGYSVLKALSDRLCGLPLTIPAQTDPIQYAAALVASQGLRVNVQQNQTYALTAPHTFEPDDSYLTVVNWCLTNCSTQYQAAFVDGYGTVQIQPYQEPTSRSAAWTFKDDAKSIMQPVIQEENEWQTSANVVRLYYESDSEAMWAVAKALDGSRAALANRGGREITYYELVDEVSDLAALEALAVTRLKDRCAEIERVSLTHAYVPISTGDPVKVEYADRSWSGTVQNMTIVLTPSAQTSTQLRRYVSSALAVEIDGGTLWTA